MTFNRSVLFLTAFLLAPAGQALADDTAVVPGKTATADERQSPVSAPNQTLAAPVPDDALLGQVVYQVLLAEIALQRGYLDVAVQSYTDLVVRTRDPQIMARAIEVAGFAQRFDVAREIARRWIEIDPTSRRAQRMWVNTLILDNRYDELTPLLIRLLEGDKERLPENLLGLNRMLARNPDRVAVFHLIDAVCRPFSGLAEAHYSVAMAAVGANDANRAKQEARKALELRPDWEMAAFLLAQVLMRESPNDAIGFMQSFLERNPDAKQLRLLLARAFIGARRYADAKREFDRLLADSPDNPEIVYSVALLALQFDDLSLAETQFKHFLSLEKVPDRNPAYYYLGQIAEERKRTDEALANYAQVSTGEQYLPAQIRRARLLQANGRLDEARDSLHKIKADKPEDRVQLIIVEAALLREADRVQEAADLLESGLAQNPDQPDLLYETALLAERLNKLTVMETRLRRLIELRPDNPQAYNALGYAYADRGQRLDEARRLIEKALAMAPDDAAILDSMGWVLFRQGDPAGALTYLERSYERQKDPEIAAHMGEVLWALGRQDDARRVLREAQEKFPASQVLTDTARRLAP